MDNPYQTGAYGSTQPTATGQVSPGVIQSLAGTRPWVRLCSILGFVGAGFMILAALGMMVGGAASGMGGRSPGGFATAAPVFLGALYLVMSLMYILPSVKLWKYGTAILRLISSQSAADLEQALEQQRGFWKFVGIMILVFMVLMFIGIVLAMIAGIAAASALSP